MYSNKYLKLEDNAYRLLDTEGIVKMKEYSPNYESSYYDSDENESEKNTYSSMSDNEFDDNDIYEYDKNKFIEEIKEIINEDFKNNIDIDNTITQINITKISFNIDYDDFEKLIYISIEDILKNNNIKQFNVFILPIVHEFIKNELLLNKIFKIINKQ